MESRNFPHEISTGIKADATNCGPQVFTKVVNQLSYRSKYLQLRIAILIVIIGVLLGCETSGNSIICDEKADTVSQPISPLFPIINCPGNVFGLDDSVMPNFACDSGGGIISLRTNWFPTDTSDSFLRQFHLLRDLQVIGPDCDTGERNCKKMKEIPPSVLKIKTIEHLTFMLHSLDSFPNELAELPHLRYLDLSHNFAIRLSNLKSLPELDTLLIYDSGLTDEEAKHLAKMKSVKALGLAGNALSAETITYLKNTLPKAHIDF